MKAAIQQKPSRKGRTKKTTNLNLKSMLVPIDFSDCSCKALDYAKALAEKFGRRIGLVHVLETNVVFSDLKNILAGAETEMLATARNCLNHLARRKLGGLSPIYSDVRLGRSYHEICQSAKKHRADLIIIGTHGRSGIKRILLGSTAEHVVRHAPCSVLVVRGLERNKTDEFKPKKILVPVDFSPGSNNAVKQALALAKRFHAKLQLIHVVPVHYPNNEYDYLDYGLLAVDSRIEAQKKISALAKRLASNGVAVQKTVGYGRPATEIINAVSQLRPDLIVISTHGLTGLDRVLLGSTTEEVVRHAGCPVLVVRGHNEK